MQVRLKLCSLAIMASVLPTSAIFLMTGRWIPAAAAIVAQVVSAAGLIAVTIGRVPAAKAGAVVFVEWLAVVIAVVLAESAVGESNVESWLVLLVVGYSIGQLERTWYLVGLVAAIAAVVVSMNWSSEPVGPHIVTFASMIGLSVLCWFSSGVFVNRLEQLRSLDARHASELAEALATTSRALAEREAMEAERERVMEQLMLSQRMEAVGRLASGIAHDMNNVLAGVVGMASLIRNDVPVHVHDDLDAIISSGHRGAELTRSLLAFARHERMRDEQFELTRIAEEVQLIVRRTQPKTVDCELVITDRPVVVGDPTLVTQALLNLCLNAVDATQAQGTIVMELSSVELALRDAEPFGLPAGRYAQLSVRDDGVGMDEDTRAHMFEPFFTTKALGEGTGLGLSMVYGTVRAHAGAVHAISTPGDGATFTMLLPAPQRVTLDLTDQRPTITAPRGPAWRTSSFTRRSDAV